MHLESHLATGAARVGGRGRGKWVWGCEWAVS